jgi:NAD(P)-dependent dehydrogenase (short-subunit alcohol dehydrogenase family)
LPRRSTRPRACTARRAHSRQLRRHRPARQVIGREGAAVPLKDSTKIVDVNLFGTFNVLSKFAARLHAAAMDREERGVIVNTASVAALNGQIG